MKKERKRESTINFLEKLLDLVLATFTVDVNLENTCLVKMKEEENQTGYSSKSININRS